MTMITDMNPKSDDPMTQAVLNEAIKQALADSDWKPGDPLDPHNAVVVLEILIAAAATLIEEQKKSGAGDYMPLAIEWLTGRPADMTTLIETAFTGRMIKTEDDFTAALVRDGVMLKPYDAK
jgi:hypothetical protein